MGIIFNDLWTRQIINSPDQWVARVSEHWEWYFNTQATYAAMRDRRVDTTVEEYLELRLGNGAVPLCLVLGEKMNFTYLAPHIHHTTQLRLLRKMASDIIVYCNDVYSSVRDAKNDDSRNLITIICNQDGCDWQEAVARCEQAMSSLDRSMQTCGNAWTLRARSCASAMPSAPRPRRAPGSSTTGTGATRRGRPRTNC